MGLNRPQRNMRSVLCIAAAQCTWVRCFCERDIRRCGSVCNHARIRRYRVRVSRRIRTQMGSSAKGSRGNLRQRMQFGWFVLQSGT